MLGFMARAVHLLGKVNLSAYGCLPWASYALKVPYLCRVTPGSDDPTRELV